MNNSYQTPVVASLTTSNINANSKNAINYLNRMMTEEHFMLAYNHEENQFEIIKKNNMSCETRHTRSIQELMSWYRAQLDNLTDYNKELFFTRYASHASLTIELYLKKIIEFISLKEEEHPEYFI